MGAEFKFKDKGASESFYTSLLATGISYIAGVDECGRGAFAGKVVVACVVLPTNHNIEGIKDSKKLSARRRETLSKEIKEKSIWAIGSRSNLEIDKFNIREATFQAATDAVLKCFYHGAAIEHVLCDGGLDIGNRIPFPQNSIVKGDLWFECIGAASIIAKVYRDAEMAKLHEVWPEYGFNTNQGYGTKFHQKAIQKYGISPLHRRTYGMCRNARVRNDGS